MEAEPEDKCRHFLVLRAVSRASEVHWKVCLTEQLRGRLSCVSEATGGPGRVDYQFEMLDAVNTENRRGDICGHKHPLKVAPEANVDGCGALTLCSDARTVSSTLRGGW